MSTRSTIPLPAAAHAPGSPLFAAAWDALLAELPALHLARPGCSDVEQVSTNGAEVWQLMGCYQCNEPNTDWDPPIVAEFRHRDHPVSGRREYVSVEVCRVGAQMSTDLWECPCEECAALQHAASEVDA